MNIEIDIKKKWSEGKEKNGSENSIETRDNTGKSKVCSIRIP